MEKSEYEEVINTIKTSVKTIIGLFLVIVSGIILYTMLYHAEWWIQNIKSEFVLALTVVITLTSLSVGIILVCERLK